MQPLHKQQLLQEEKAALERQWNTQGISSDEAERIGEIHRDRGWTVENVRRKREERFNRITDAFLGQFPPPELRELCSRLIQDYEKGENNIPVEEPATPTAKSGAVSPTLQQIQDLQNSTGTVIFCYQEKKKPKGNLRGIIKDYGFPAGISKAMLAGFGEGFEPKIGDEFETVVDRWDANAGMFNLMAP